MAIRISHARVETTVKAAAAAGKGKQQVAERNIQVQQQAQAQREQVQIFQAGREMNFRIKKFQADETNRMQTMEFQSFVAEESKRRQMAFEVEKIEMRQRHDFEMLEAGKEIKHQAAMQKEFKEDQEMNQKFKALDHSVERGQLSRPDADREKLRLTLGVPASGSDLWRRPSTVKENPYGDFLSSFNSETATKTRGKVVRRVRDNDTGKIWVTDDKNADPADKSQWWSE